MFEASTTFLFEYTHGGRKYGGQISAPNASVAQEVVRGGYVIGELVGETPDDGSTEKLRATTARIIRRAQ